MQVSCVSFHSRQLPNILAWTPPTNFPRLRRSRPRSSLPRLHVLNLDSRDGLLQVYQEEVEASPEKVVVLDSAEFNRLFIEASFVRSKVQDLTNLTHHAETLLEDLVRLHSGVLELKKVDPAPRRGDFGVMVKKPALKIKHRMTWEAPENSHQLVKTSRALADRSRGGISTEPRGESFSNDVDTSVMSSNPFRLLTSQEECMLARKVQYMSGIEKLKSRFHRVHGRLPSWTELGALRNEKPVDVQLQYQDGARAKQIMIDRNMRLVISIAARLQRPGSELRDLAVDGVFGLVRAIEKFDPERGYKLSTYAHWWIRQMIARSMSDKSQVIQIPVNVVMEHQRMKRKVDEYSQRHGVVPKDEAIADEMGLTVRRFTAIKHAYKSTVSIESPTGGYRDAFSLDDLIKDEKCRTAEEQYAEDSMKEDLDLVLSTLPEKEALVLRMRYGLDDGNHRTLESLGNRFNVTKERIRQIEVKALRRLQQRSGNLKEYTQTFENKWNRPVAAANLKSI